MSSVRVLVVALMAIHTHQALHAQLEGEARAYSALVCLVRSQRLGSSIYMGLSVTESFKDALQVGNKCGRRVEFIVNH